MLTVILQTMNDEERLARALVPLVSAAAEGFLRDVIVVDAGSTDGTRTVADLAGCTLMEAETGADKGADRGADVSLLRAAEQARGTWLLVLNLDQPPLPRDWQTAAQAYVEKMLADGREKRAFVHSGRFSAGLLASFISIFRRPEGMLIPKAEILRRQK